MKYAFMFPGQGSQKVGMGKDLFEETTIGKDLYKKVDECVGRNLSEVIFNGPQEELNQTKNTQIAIAATSMALVKILEEEANKNNLSFSPSACCGHSLGEYSALWYAGVLSTEDTFKLIAKRGELMQNAPSGAMAAVLNLNEDQVKNIISNYNDKVIIANYNTDSQYVLSGNKEVFEDLASKVKEAGGKAIILPVSGAFHSKLMEEPSKTFIEAIESVKQLSDAKIPVYQNIDAKSEVGQKIIIEKLKKQMTSSVYWTQTINNLVLDGVTNFVEIGPGRVLAGLVKKINKDAKCYNLSDLTSIKDFIANNEHGLFLQQA